MQEDFFFPRMKSCYIYCNRFQFTRSKTHSAAVFKSKLVIRTQSHGYFIWVIIIQIKYTILSNICRTPNRASHGKCKSPQSCIFSLDIRYNISSLVCSNYFTCSQYQPTDVQFSLYDLLILVNTFSCLLNKFPISFSICNCFF